MSKKIKQDYDEQKRQAAETNAVNQLETFHAESMTMEAHKSKTRGLLNTVMHCYCSSLGKILGEIHHVHAVQKLGYDQIEILVAVYH